MRPLRMFLENHNFNMSVKSKEVEMDKNACSYFVSSLVPIEFILRLNRYLILAANFWTICQTENHTLSAFSNFFGQNMPLVQNKGHSSQVTGPVICVLYLPQNMSYPRKWSLTDDS